MKVLLVVPTFHYKNSLTFLSVSDFPTGFGYIAASLREVGHEVYGLNLNNIVGFQSNYYMITNKIYNTLQEVKPDLIGLGGICTDFAFLKDAMEVIRKFTPKTPIVLGGGIVTNDREFIFNLLKPDFCITGEAEETIVKLANVLYKVAPSDLEGIDNLGYWKDGRAVFNKINHTYRDVNERPSPDYEPFGIQDMMDNYSGSTRVLYRYSRPYPRPFVIVTARGCPFNCTFCIHQGNQYYHGRSIENIMEEIKVNYERYKFNILIVVDELFAVNKKRMADFCEGVLEGKEKYGWDFDWMFQTHANARLDREVLELAKKSGCYFFSYGLESASPRVLESMNKKTKIPQLIEAIKLAQETNIGFGGNLIFGDIAENEDTIYETLEFYHKYCQSSFVFLGLLMPYPGSKLFDVCMARGIITDKQKYYETIDSHIFNMTLMPNNQWLTWVNFFLHLEASWIWVKTTEAFRWEEESGSMYKIWAECPYCGKEIAYRQQLGESDIKKTRLFLGVGCTNCNRKIRVNLPISSFVKAERELVMV